MDNSLPNTYHYYTWGTKGKDIVVFIHANSFCAGMYKHVFEPLLLNYQILALEIPGCGLSKWDGEIRKWDNIANYLKEFLIHQNITTPVYAIGHSVGAISMILCAHQNPHLFKQLVLWDPVVLPKIRTFIFQIFIMMGKEDVMPLIKASRKRTTIFSSRNVALSHYKHKRIFKHLSSESLEAYIDFCFTHFDDNRLKIRCSPKLEISIYQSIPVNIWKNIRQLKVKTNIIAGNHSDTLSPKVIQKLKRINKYIRIDMVDGGHLFPFENKEETAKLTLEALHDY